METMRRSRLLCAVKDYCNPMVGQQFGSNYLEDLVPNVDTFSTYMRVAVCILSLVFSLAACSDDKSDSEEWYTESSDESANDNNSSSENNNETTSDEILSSSSNRFW